MTELIDTVPDTNVQLAEYCRLLGYPPEHQLSSRALELTNQSREWYAIHGSPWVYARLADVDDIADSSVCIEGQSFHSPDLHAALEQAEAETVFLVAVSAGLEIELEAQQRWCDEKPDEYFFLEVYGSAVAEHLITMCGARLCAWAEPQGMAVLPHLSPGYSNWDVSDQPKLLELIRADARSALPGQLKTLTSGMLWPKKSLLAVFGVTRHAHYVRRLTTLNSCERCSFLPCQFRRAPYRRAQSSAGITISSLSQPASAEISSRALALDDKAIYSINRKALDRWTAERLVLTHHANGAVDALFRYEGTTCTNLGRRLLFHYHVSLGPEAEGYPIWSQRCTPAPGDDGFTSMCRYMENSDALMAAIDGERPLLGKPLNQVLDWESPGTVAGCYCELSDRMHKWRLVLETIHYALVQHAMSRPQSTNHLATVS